MAISAVVLVLLAAVLTVALAREYEATKTGYAAWAQTHGRHHEPTSAQWRAWRENHAFVRMVNADKSSTWKAELNHFADMTAEDFKKSVLLPAGAVDAGVNARFASTKAPKAPAAASFDWKGTGAVTPVKDQGTVGTCWAFSTIANIEGQHYMATNTTLSLSEEFLVDCDGTADNDLKHADCSIFGGWPYLAYQFAMARGGVPSEEAYPYCAGTGDCFPCMQGPESLCGPPPYYCDREERAQMCAAAKPAASIKDWRSVSTDESEILDDLVATGPLSVLLDAQMLQFYKSGIWTGSNRNAKYGGCSPKALDHAVLLTGYGTDGSTDYWNVKNSWGPKWGEEGYFRIQRGVGECGINTFVTTSVV